MFWLLFVLSLLFVLYNVHRWRVVRSQVHVPFVSTLWPFIYCLPLVVYARKNFYELLTEEGLRHGTFAFYTPMLEPGPWVFLNKPEDAKFILEHVDDFPKREIGDLLRVFLGRGIFATDGEEWQIQRKNASHLFKVRELKQMAEVFANHGEQLCELLQNEAGKKIDIQNLFSRFTFDAFSEIAYGAKFDSLHDPNNKFCKAFNVAQALTTERILFPIVKMLGPFGWILPSERRLAAAMKELHSTTSEILRAHRSTNKSDDDAPRSLLARFVDENLSDVAIQENVLNFLLAGRDTTATTLTFAIYHVFKNPAIVSRMRDEIANYGDRVTFENHTAFKYTIAVMDEVLRLAPAVPLDTKVSVRDAVLPSGVKVSANTGVAWTAFLMGHDPSLYPNPKKFDPERFLDPNQISNIPFQFGPRRCLGERMAYLEIVSVLVLLVSRFDFVIPEQTLVFEPSITLFASSGVFVIPKPIKN